MSGKERKATGTEGLGKPGVSIQRRGPGDGVTKREAPFEGGRRDW